MFASSHEDDVYTVLYIEQFSRAQAPITEAVAQVITELASVNEAIAQTIAAVALVF